MNIQTTITDKVPARNKLKLLEQVMLVIILHLQT